MSVHPPFAVGIEHLLEHQRDLLRGRRVGLVCHAASLTADGSWSATRLWEDPEIELCCLFGPEHGVFGQAGAGEDVGTQRHPGWGIPVHSLYGPQRAPTSEMLADLELLIVDLQDLGVRCYTYGSTLALVLESAEASGIPVLVADRPIPFSGVIDGPPLDPAWKSFVATLPAPLVYGLTPAETALFLQASGWIRADLQVIPMTGYRPTGRRPPDGPPWAPPSTSIRSWESAWCYPVTVFTEALPMLDCGRFGPLPFQVLGAPWLPGGKIIAALADDPPPGVRLHLHWVPVTAPGGLTWVEGIRFTVVDPAQFRPVALSLRILEAIQQEGGPERLWESDTARPEFFDQLYGTSTVRETLQRGTPVRDLIAGWRDAHRSFRSRCEPCRLYGA